MTNISIAVATCHPELHETAKQLAVKLDLPCEFEISKTYHYLLIVTPEYIGLQNPHTKSKPVYIDFLSPQLQIRRKQASLRKEMLAKALGLKNKSPKNIVDTTAGLARDSFILASLGFEVTLLERSPIIFVLLENAITRAKQDPKMSIIMKRMNLIHANAIDWLKFHNKPDIIYLDPMFPERKKSALSKQDMRIFHEVVGHDLDADELLRVALTCATERVVVKRPRLAPALAELKPSLTMQGSSNRFDIYLTSSHGYITLSN